MDSHEQQHDQQLAALRAEYTVILERDLAKAAAAQDLLKNERTYFLLLLVAARRAKGLSQAQLATKLGMQQSALSRIENGRGNPGLCTLLTIAKALDVHLVLE